MSHKITTYIRTTTPIRGLIGVVILLFVSSSLESAGLKERYSYIDCSGDVIGKIIQLKYLDYKDKFEHSYQIDYLNKTISIYTVKNEYKALCVKEDKCTEIVIINDEFITSDVNSPTYGHTDYTRINRLSGRFEKRTTWSSKYDIEFDYTGQCESGLSKLQTKQKF